VARNHDSTRGNEGDAMVVWRRTLFCKTGQTKAVVEGCIAVGRIMRGADDSVRAYRVYTDLSGRTERVITEIERDILVHPRDASRKIHGRADALQIFAQIGPLIESAQGRVSRP
jgi:hypothetical protein